MTATKEDIKDTNTEAAEVKPIKGYIEAVGRRKTSVARVRLMTAGKSSFMVNNRDFVEYFPTDELRLKAREAIINMKLPAKFKVTAMVNGGGISSQAEAVRLGVSRALTEYDSALRSDLKKMGFLKRDPRAKERRKFGLKKARKAPQWSKR